MSQDEQTHGIERHVASPVRLVFDESKHIVAHKSVPLDHLRELALSVFPDDSIQLPKEASKLKPPTFSKWDRASVPILQHLQEVKRIAEIQIRRGFMKFHDEFFDSLLDSVKIISLCDWHNVHSAEYKTDSVMLIVLLLAHFHSGFESVSSYHELTALPLNVDVTDMLDFVAAVERAVPRVGALYTARGLCVEIVRHVADHIVCKLDLHTKIDSGLGVTHLVGLLRNEVTKSVSFHPSAQQRVFHSTPSTPHLHPPSNTAPNAMDVDVLAKIDALTASVAALSNGRGGGRAGREGRGGKGGKGAGRGKSAVTCFKCGGRGHFKDECPTQGE